MVNNCDNYANIIYNFDRVYFINSNNEYPFESILFIGILWLFIICLGLLFRIAITEMVAHLKIYLEWYLAPNKQIKMTWK